MPSLRTEHAWDRVRSRMASIALTVLGSIQTEGKDVVIGMLIVGLVILGVICLGELADYLSARRK
jgi:hypothetical protein